MLRAAWDWCSRASWHGVGPSHYRPAAEVATGPKGPTTTEGVQLALEVNASTVLAADAKTRLVAEIMNHEATHGRCTKTFLKKVRKQARGQPIG